MCVCAMCEPSMGYSAQSLVIVALLEAAQKYIRFFDTFFILFHLSTTNYREKGNLIQVVPEIRGISYTWIRYRLLN